MEKNYRVIIAGGREFNDYESLKKYCDYLLQNKYSVEIVCGMARGADLLGKRYAEENGYELAKFPAKWTVDGVYNKAAGYIRNAEMAKYGDAAIVFWDGKSKGSKHMIDLAKEYGLSLRIFRY